MYRVMSFLTYITQSMNISLFYLPFILYLYDTGVSSCYGCDTPPPPPLPHSPLKLIMVARSKRIPDSPLDLVLLLVHDY